MKRACAGRAAAPSVTRSAVVAGAPRGRASNSRDSATSSATGSSASGEVDGDRRRLLLEQPHPRRAAGQRLLGEDPLLGLGQQVRPVAARGGAGGGGRSPARRWRAAPRRASSSSAAHSRSKNSSAVSIAVPFSSTRCSSAPSAGSAVSTEKRAGARRCRRGRRSPRSRRAPASRAISPAPSSAATLPAYAAANASARACASAEQRVDGGLGVVGAGAVEQVGEVPRDLLQIGIGDGLGASCPTETRSSAAFGRAPAGAWPRAGRRSRSPRGAARRPGRRCAFSARMPMPHISIGMSSNTRSARSAPASCARAHQLAVGLAHLAVERRRQRHRPGELAHDLA